MAENQLNLFGERDPRYDLLPEDKKWNYYDNPTPYQKHLNDMMFQCYESLGLLKKQGGK